MKSLHALKLYLIWWCKYYIEFEIVHNVHVPCHDIDSNFTRVFFLLIVDAMTYLIISTRFVSHEFGTWNIVEYLKYSQIPNSKFQFSSNWIYFIQINTKLWNSKKKSIFGVVWKSKIFHAEFKYFFRIYDSVDECIHN